MSKSVMLSIRPKWCEKIANGEKTIEVRKTKPNLETPFKCYIYCTLPKYPHEDFIATDYPRPQFYGDSKGKLRKPSDSPRYKACGNSIALPFWDFLAKRISAQYLRPVTMGSLFDGIGGFPLVFERHNGKGTARWASEIEQFPIAVTKLRFGEE